MTITLYKNESPNNAVDKALTDAIEFPDSKVKERQGISDINIVFKSDTSMDVLGYNYLYIDSLKRYYFINKINVTPNGIYVLECHVDVLATYKSEILALELTAIESENNFNPTFSNVNYDYALDTEFKKFPFNNPFLENGVNVLIGV